VLRELQVGTACGATRLPGPLRRRSRNGEAQKVDRIMNMNPRASMVARPNGAPSPSRKRAASVQTGPQSRAPAKAQVTPHAKGLRRPWLPFPGAHRRAGKSSPPRALSSSGSSPRAPYQPTAESADQHCRLTQCFVQSSRRPLSCRWGFSTRQAFEPSRPPPHA